ncbi:hypothetical protein [Novosphingobium cyanobacteriorum]|uniref:Carboxypeptidase regulatory-like domain-containing protein n=1 Tax=Novosphingobium cyanobacteriorum TaxID=3024215 RepID=A0ABT6CEW1_9SPHN|nr:hypothetical protein [Novosphingobium cyanobacteriorum]MDF8332089.1 hypothetical protein [Novosphingobium cyanobacteriorum]
MVDAGGSDARAEVRESGVRDMPFGFASAMSIVSDVDAANQPLYAAYVGQIVGRYGLDFGDSCWLRWHGVEARSGAVLAHSLAFFTDSFTDGSERPAAEFRQVRTLNHNVNEYLSGNLEHFHSYLPYGPRVVWMRAIERDGDRLRAPAAQYARRGAYHCRDFQVMAACLRPAEGQALDGARVTLVARTRRLELAPAEVVVARQDAEQRFYTVPERERFALSELEAVEIEGCPADAVGSIMLLDGYSDIVLDRLHRLRRDYGISPSLVTEHSGVHFRSDARALVQDQEMARYLEADTGATTGALNGRYRAADGRLVFSTEADVDGSFGRTLPEVVRDLDVRFMVPVAGGRGDGWPRDEVVGPLTARNGATVYQARRTMPALDPVQYPHLNSGRTWQDSFAVRLSQALDGAESAPGDYWPLYTHLGAVPQETRTALMAAEPANVHGIPSPYLDESVIGRLSASVFGKGEAGARIWLASASMVYDHALIRQSIERHVTRSGANRIDIASWDDPVLGRRLPVAPTQLYGQTFYVDDAAVAEVRLDGVVLDQIVRNRPDETGRPSVTVAACGVEVAVFHRLDPFARSADVCVDGGAWRWLDGDEPMGELTLGAAGRAEMVIPMHGWALMGAQLLRYSLLRDAGVQAAVVLETLDGARFLFGDLAVDGSPTASRALTHPAGLREIAPFHDLVWHDAASTALPSHPLQSVRLIATGAPGAVVRFADMALLRPQSRTTVGRAPGWVVVGSLGARWKDCVVRLHPVDGAAQEALPDQNGWFCFTGVPDGIYRLCAVGPTGERVDRRGALIEVGRDVFDLLLDREA